MKTEADIKKALEEMEIRRKSYVLDMCSTHVPNSVVYNTDIIRKLEVTDSTIHTLKWVLENPIIKKFKKQKKSKS